MGAVEHARYALGEHPHKRLRVPNVGVIVTAKSFSDGIENEIIPKLESVVGSRDIRKIKNNKQGKPSVIQWRSGSVTFLMSAEQDDVAFESKTIHHAWIDEPVRRTIFVGIKRGMLTTGGHLWFTCTPLDEPWMYEEIYLKGSLFSFNLDTGERNHKPGVDSEIDVFEGSSDQNLRISKVERDEFKSRLTEDEIQARWFGKFRHLAGRVFKEYTPDRHLVKSRDIPEHWPVWVSIDPHRQKPHAVLFLAISPHNVKYICNEIYYKCTMAELAEYIKDVGSQYNIVETLIDTSAQEQGWGKHSARQILAQNGVHTKLAQKKNLKNSRILIIQQWLKNEELFVMEHCIRTHKEFQNYIYKKNKRDEQKILEEPEKKFDEMMDNLGYIAVENPSYGGIARIKETARGVYGRSEHTGYKGRRY